MIWEFSFGWKKEKSTEVHMYDQGKYYCIIKAKKIKYVSFSLTYDSN